MLVLLSPAKNLNFDPPTVDVEYTQPELMKETKALITHAKELSAGDLKRMMKISDDLAQLNYERFQAFKSRQTPNNAKQAVLTFNGDVYWGLEAKSLSAEDLTWAQDHLRILSGLYGVLRPLDLIQPYRLVMGSRLATEAGPDLYSYWGDRIAKSLNKSLKKSGGKTIVNLASNEYFSAVKSDALKGQVITVDFREYRDGVLRSLQFFVKRARGAMARFIIQNRIEDPEQLKGFDIDRYRFDPDLSTDEKFLFTREGVKAA